MKTYKALTSFKVQNDAGEVRVVKRGDPVPEAAGWPNVQAYLKRQWIELADDANPTPVAAPVAAPIAAPVSVVVDAPTSDPVVDDADDAADPPEGGYSESALNRMPKKELQALAEILDIDPDQTNADLAACILLAQE